MSFTGLFFLSSGLFLGWSLGANDASNIFGTAVATRMVKFKTAAFICSVFVLLGAVISGVGAAHTLGDLGAVNAIGGSFVTAFSAAFVVYAMTKLGLPVSVSQAVVGAIIGWNWFTDSVTDTSSLVKIGSTWIACPVIAALFAIPTYLLFHKLSNTLSLSLLRRDLLTRLGLIVTGAFGAYALGANNMANVVGVFISVSPFTDFTFMGMNITPVHQLFAIGGLMVALGIYTYSYKVMMTVGDGLLPLSSMNAFVVVLAESLVLFIFASEGLEYFLASHGLPTIPLVPVSSTQAVVGAVLGIGIIKGGKGIRWSVLGRIVCGWVTTPVITAVICFISLYIMQNVFDQSVYQRKTYQISQDVIAQMKKSGINNANKLLPMDGERFSSGQQLIREVHKYIPELTNKETIKIVNIAQITPLYIDIAQVKKLPSKLFSPEEISEIKLLSGQYFNHDWQLENALGKVDKDWLPLPSTVLNKQKNKELQSRIQILERVFKWESQD